MYKSVIGVAVIVTIIGLLIAGCSRPQGSESFRIASVNAEEAFTVFLQAVQEQRDKAAEKEREGQLLQQQYMNGLMSKDEFEDRYSQLLVEKLEANLNISVAALNKMISSDHFEDMRAYLEQLKAAADPLIKNVGELVAAVQIGALDRQELQERYLAAGTEYTKFEQLLSESAKNKIDQAAGEVAKAEGYDLVLRSREVIAYVDSGKITDITDLVKEKLAEYF